jgi:hypothetical protein
MTLTKTGLSVSNHNIYILYRRGRKDVFYDITNIQ